MTSHVDWPSAPPEVRKLAHSLGVEPIRLRALAALPVDDLRLLRSQVAEAMFQAGKAQFAALATVAGAVPVAVSARITERVLPPLLAARTAELIDPRRAIELVARLSDEYLADVSAAMDASRAPAVVAGIPPERVARVAAELARRGEWVVIGAFVGHVSSEALAASVRALTGVALLRAAYVLDEHSRLEEIGSSISDRQRDDILRAAVEDGLWAELADLVERSTPAQVHRLAARFAALPRQLREAYDRAADGGALPRAAWEDLRGG